MADLRVTKLLSDFSGCTEIAFKAAGVAWHNELSKYPPQRGLRQRIRYTKAGRLVRGRKESDVRYKRTGTLGRKARGQLAIKSVELGGVFYTPYVIQERKSPASLEGTTVWPGKLDAAEEAAVDAFKETFLIQMMSIR